MKKKIEGRSLKGLLACLNPLRISENHVMGSSINPLYHLGLAIVDTATYLRGGEVRGVNSRSLWKELLVRAKNTEVPFSLAA